MRFTEFVNQFKAPRTLPPVFLITGEESFLREQAISKIQSAHPDFKAQSIRLNASETTPDAFTDELYTPAFMGQRKLVVVLDDQNMFPAFRDRLKQFIDAPSGVTHLVWAAPNAKGWESLKKHAVWIECDSLAGPELIEWIVALARRHSKKIDRSAALNLVQRAGVSLTALENHVEKLCLYAGARAAVTSADVDALVSGEEDGDVRELVQAIQRKSAGEALTVLNRILDHGGNAQMLLGYLAWHYRRLASSPGSGPKDKHGHIFRADWQIKTSNIPEPLILETLVCDLAR